MENVTTQEISWMNGYARGAGEDVMCVRMYKSYYGKFTFVTKSLCWF